MKNPGLGRRVLDVIDAQPSRLVMTHWVSVSECGTTACLAGHVLLLEGYGVSESRPGDLPPDFEFIHPETGDAVDPEAEAARLLGMSPGELGRSGEDELPLFMDFVFGLSRFRRLVEAAEGQAA